MGTDLSPKLFESEFVKTLVTLYSEEASIIGTRFSTFPGEFNQGLQTKMYKKLH